MTYFLILSTLLYTCPLYHYQIFSDSGEFNYFQERYTSYEDAVEGHKKAVELVKNKIKEQ